MLQLIKALPREAELLTLLQKRAFDDDARRFGGLEKGGPPGYDSTEWQQTMMEKTLYYKILREENLIGGVIVYPTEEGEYELGRIFIDPAWQNQGLGLAVIRQLEEFLPEAEVWNLGTPSWAVRNHHLYEKAGFVKIGEVSHPGGFIEFRYRKIKGRRGELSVIADSEELCLLVAGREDMEDICEVYNSNEKFLRAHTGLWQITGPWLEQEFASMAKAGFFTWKLVEKKRGKTIGVVDIKPDEETYLSLLMVHGDWKRKGLGKAAYQLAEDYLRRKGCRSVRIDVVTGYNPKVEVFWKEQGFSKTRDVTMEWAGQKLAASTMHKALEPMVFADNRKG